MKGHQISVPVTLVAHQPIRWIKIETFSLFSTEILTAPKCFSGRLKQPAVLKVFLGLGTILRISQNHPSTVGFLVLLFLPFAKINGSQEWSMSTSKWHQPVIKRQQTWDKQKIIFYLCLKMLRKNSHHDCRMGAVGGSQFLWKGALGNGNIYMTPLQCGLAQKLDKRKK